MSFNIGDYYPTREELGNPPDEIAGGITGALRRVVDSYIQLSNYPKPQEVQSAVETAATYIANAVTNERPTGFYNIKRDEKELNIEGYFSAVLSRVPDILTVLDNYSKTDGGKLTQETDETHTTNAGETSTTATNKEKFNPVEAPFSRLSNESTNETNGTATSGGISTVTRSKNGKEQLEAYEGIKNPLRPIVRAICGALVYTAEELEEVYYLDNEE